MSLSKALRRVGIIAWGEAFRTGSSFNKRTSLVLFAIGLVASLALPPLLSGGLQFDRGIYRAAVAPDAPLLPATLANHVFAVSVTSDPLGAMRDGKADIAILPSTVFAVDGSKGESALAALKQAAKDYTFQNLARETNQGAAFPIRVELQYAHQDRGDGSATAPLPTNLQAPTPTAPTQSNSGTVSGGGTTTSGGSTSGQTSATPVSSSTSTSGFSFLPPERSVNTPETLTPPFPFRSLLLAYIFLIPMNFVVQVYAGSAIGERLGRKGEALLASPAQRWEIILGKALPYFLMMMGISAGIVLFIHGSWLSLIAVAPLVIAFLAMEFLAAMFARSFRELTFLTVFTSVLLTIYAFLPAVFSEVHPVALISPITLVVFDLTGVAVTWGQILYATVPLLIFSGVLFILGAALYTEEDLFHQKPVMSKAVDAVGRQVKGLLSAIKIPILLIPLVLIVELLLLTFLFAWPVSTGTLGVLVAIALVEEAFKAVPSFAAQKRGIISPQRAVLFGALVGLGFFLAEKGFLLLSLAGVLDLQAGSIVFGSPGSLHLGEAPIVFVVLLLFAPLLLHMGTASITGWGAKKGGSTFWLSFLTAVIIHTTYNFTLVKILGGGLL